MNRLAKWLYSIGFFLAMCGILAAGTYQYKDNLSIPYNINLFTCGSASCTSMVLQNSSGTELFNGANPGAVLATIQNILVSPISIGISSGSSPVNVTGNFTATIASPAAMNVVQVQNVNIASPNTYGVAPVGSVEGVNAFVTNNVNVTPPTPLNVTISTPLNVTMSSPVSVAISTVSSPINVTGNLTTNSASPTTINLEQVQNVNVASPSTYGVAPVGSVQGVNAFVTNNVNVTPPTPLGVTLPASPLSVGIAGPTPLQVTLPGSPISVGIAGPTPLNVTIATGTNITQIAGNNIASPTGYGTAPVGSVQGVNAFVTNSPTVVLSGSPVSVGIASGSSPVNVTIGGTPLNVTLAGPTPLNVTIASTPQNMTLATGVNITQIAGNNIASPTGYGTAPVGSVQGVNAFITNAPSVTTTPAVSPQNVTIAGPTPLNVTIGGTPLNVTLAGPTPLNVTVGGIVSPQNVTIAGPTPLNVTIGGTPLNVTLAGPTPLNVVVTPIGLALTVANPASVVSAYIATNAYALTGSLIAIGATPGIVGIHQLASAACSSPSPNGTPASAYLRFFDTTPHATGFDIALTVGTQSLGSTNLTVVGSPIQQTQITFPPPGIQFNKGIVFAFTQGAVGSSTAVGYNVHCSFSYN